MSEMKLYFQHSILYMFYIMSRYDKVSKKLYQTRKHFRRLSNYIERIENEISDLKNKEKKLKSK